MIKIFKQRKLFKWLALFLVTFGSCSQPTEKNIVTGQVSDDTVKTDIAAPDTSIVE